MSGEPICPPVVKAGLLAFALDEAMARLHSCHRLDPQRWDDWRRCETSTLCREASRLLDGCELEMAVARDARGETAAEVDR